MKASYYPPTKKLFAFSVIRETRIFLMEALKLGISSGATELQEQLLQQALRPWAFPLQGFARTPLPRAQLSFEAALECRFKPEIP